MLKLRLDDLIDGIRAGHPDQPLDQLTAAVLTAEHVNEISDHLIGHFVDQARRSGASWTEIGSCIGVTKQAAQQRFVPKNDQNMFSRFTPRARQVLVGAMEAAHRTRAQLIEPEHLVLGLLNAPGGLALLALGDQGITVEVIGEAAEAALPKPVDDEAQPLALIPYSSASKKVLELAVREALRLGHNYIGTEHVLLALLDREAEAAGVLTALGADPAGVEGFVLAALEEMKPV
jgi:hypothetical protein